VKDSHQILVLSFVLVLIGIILIGVSRTVNIPETHNIFLTAQALFVMGFFFLGFALGVFGAIGYVLRLERKVSQIPPPSHKVCRYCGWQNLPDSLFCSKCGKRLT
jgi:amino acid transporter